MSVNLSVGEKEIIFFSPAMAEAVKFTRCLVIKEIFLQWEMYASLSFGEFLIPTCCRAITHVDTGPYSSPSRYVTNIPSVRGRL